MRSNVDVDLIYHYLGRFGRYQMYQTVLLIICLVPVSYVSITVVFVGFEPSYHCRLPPDNDPVCNGTSTNCSFILDGKCGLYNATSNDTSTCVYGYEYDIDLETSIISEWNLVCERGHLGEMSQLAFTVGQAVGGFAWSVLADLYGRKPMYILSFVTALICQVITIFSPDITFYAILRFFCGATMEGLNNLCYVMGVENFPGKYVTPLCVVYAGMWSLGFIILPAFAWPLSYYSWRYFHAVVILSGLYIIYQIFVMDESIRWLFSVGKTDKAVELLRKAARINRVSFDNIEKYLNEESDDLLPRRTTNKRNLFRMVFSCCESKLAKNLNEGSFETEPIDALKPLKVDYNADEKVNDADHKHKVADNSLTRTAGKPDSLVESRAEKTDLTVIVRHKHLRQVLLAQLFIWPTNALTYYGLILMSNSFAGNRFVNFSLGGVAEMAGVFIILFSVRWLGCKKSCIYLHFICAILLILAVVLGAVSAEIIPPALHTVFSIAARMGITATYIGIYLYVPQLFPTPIRSLGVGLCTLASRCGYIVATYANYFAKRVLWGPPAVFAVLCFISALLCFVPPETYKKPLAQTVEDFEKFYEKRKKKRNEIL